MKNNNLSKRSFQKKWMSYSALASAFMIFNPTAHGQCGTADATNPLLGIDIDGDGTNDVGIQWSLNQLVSTFTGGPFTGTFRYASGVAPFTRTIPGSTYTISGCSVITIPGGIFGLMSNIYAVTAGGFTGTPLTVNASGSYYASFLNATGNSNFGIQYNFPSAYALPYAGNQIVGLTTGGSNICSLACAATGNVTLGAAQTYKTFQRLYIQNYTGIARYTGPISTSVVGVVFFNNPATCTIFTFVPKAPNSALFNGPVTFPPQSSTTMGIMGNAITLTLSNSINTYQPNINNTNFIGVKFKGPDQDGDGNPDNYVGWVEITIDPKTSAITCVNTDYNSCSIESAMASGATTSCPAASDLAAGAPDPMNGCMAPCNSMVILSGIAPPLLDLESSDWIQSTQTLTGNTSIDYDAVNYVELNAGFCAPASTTFNAFIDGCDNGGGGVNAKESNVEQVKQ